MQRILLFLLISSIALVVNSCSEESPFFQVDNTAPVIAEVSIRVAAVESIVNEVNVMALLSFAAESETVISQSEYVPSLNEFKVMVLSPEETEVVLEEQEPSNDIDPDSGDENV